MADEETIDWDEVLVTRDPDQKEVSVSFVNVEKDGSPGGGDGSSPCAPGTFKHYSDSLKKNGGFEIITQPNTRITTVDYPTNMDTDFFVYVSRHEARPFDEWVSVSFQPREGSEFPWTVDKLPAPVKIRIESGQVDGKLEVKMPEGSNWSANQELYPDNEVGLYYLFDMVIDSPACDDRPLVLNSPCTEDTYVLPAVETQGRRPFLLLIDICQDDFPEGGGGPDNTVPVGGNNPECQPHDCDALLTSSSAGSVAYFIRPNTEPVIQFATGSPNVLANSQGGPSNWTVGDQDVNPISTANTVPIDGRSSKPCAINLNGAAPRVFVGSALEGNDDFGIYDPGRGDAKPPLVREYGAWGGSASMWAYIDCTGPNAATCAFDMFGGIFVGIASFVQSTGNVGLVQDSSALAGKTEVNVAGGYLKIYGNGQPLNTPSNVVVFESPITPESASGWYGIEVKGGLATSVFPGNTNFDQIQGQWTVSITTPVGGAIATQITDTSAGKLLPYLYRSGSSGYNILSIQNRGGDPAIYGISNGKPSADFGRHLVDYTPPTYCERIP